VLPALGVFGISGVGKTTLIRQYLSIRPNILSISAGRILQDRSGRSGEDLRRGAANSVQDTQAGLIEGFAEFRAANQGYGVIFDGHTVIDSDSGIVDVPLDIIIGLNLSAFVYIRDASESIARRRAADTARQRPERTSEILALHQDRAQALARDYAAKANSSFEVIQAGDIARFQAVADKLFGV